MLNPRIPIIIELPKSTQQAEILLCADVHCGSNDFNEKKWKAFEEILSKPNTYVIFCGDQCEYATRTSKSDVYTQRMSPNEQKDWWIEHLRPFAEENKILAMIDGNHEFNRASKDADDFPIYDIACRLNISDRYRSEAAFIDICIGHKPKSGIRNAGYHYVGRLSHKAQNLCNYGTADGFDGIDFFVSGHTHKPLDKPLAKLCYDVQNKAIAEKTVENIVCGHFLNYGGYRERGGYRPTSQKLYSIVLNGTKKQITTKGFYVGE